MRRAGAYVIFKKHLNNTVQRKRLNDKIIEYWIYKGKQSLLYTPSGKKWADDKNKTLDSIIICESGQKHILKENEKAIVVIGLKIYKDELSEYIAYREKVKNDR